MLKFGKFVALALAMAVAVGCSSKDGDASGEDANGGVDPNAGYGANSGAIDGSLSDGAALRVITTFYFEYDNSDLKPEAMRALDAYAKDLKGSGQRVVPEGHTDERDTREYNMALDERRAKAVQRYLVLQGVSPAQLKLVPYGKERPVTTGHGEQSWAQSRRVKLKKQEVVMPKHLRVLTFLALNPSFAAQAGIPVYDGVVANNGDNAPPSGYGTADAGGAFAEGGVATPTSVQGELFMQLQQMQDELARLRGTLEEQQNQIQQLKQKSLEHYQDLDHRISGGGAPAAQNSAPADAINANGAPAAPAGNNAPAPSSEPGDPAKEKLYYDAAFDLIKSKDFDKASQAFNAFLHKYSNSQYSGNAQYWLDEVNLAKGSLQGAGQAFAQVSQSHPGSQKMPDLLYKLADVERRLGNNDKTKGILRQVISQYPGTSAAQLAQRDLKNLR